MNNSFLKNNVHSIDRALRLIVGAVLIALVFVGPKTPFGWVGAILIATGLAGTCPIYSIIGVSTCPLKNSKSGQAT